MQKTIIFLVALLSIQYSVFAQQEARTTDGKTVVLFDNGTWCYADSLAKVTPKHIKIDKLELPKTTVKDKVVTHSGYSLLYNESHEQASWVAYELTKEETNKTVDRSNNFNIDPKVSSATADDKDYKGSGYDRGHLAPASDMGWSSTAMSESFFYSNISPQTPSFNRGIWKKLEELVRTWAIENNSIYVVTGPVLTNGLQKIGPNKVSVPTHYYKVVLDYNEPNIKSIGFIIPNIGSKESLQNYAVSIDSVEKLTGIDFFPPLEDEEEYSIEKKLCLPCWSWANQSGTNRKKGNVKLATVQCLGVTKAGARCKTKTIATTGFCYRHEGQINTEQLSNTKTK
jgi:endonuclease G